MDIVVCFALFLAAMLFCLVKGFSLAWALLFALVLFFALGLRSGYGAKALVKMAWSKMPKSMIVLRILFFIGLLTGLWRSCGTIAFFIYHGIRVITPSLFILVAFLLTVLLSYALGTSFGVASTAGVVLMALARSGGVSEAVTAGVILSGIYFGDRGAPTSSCASLVAALTETDLYGNVSRMFQTAALPYALCLIAYTVLSFRNPIVTVDETMLDALAESFVISPWALVPALIMLILPLLRVPIRRAMAISAAAAFSGLMTRSMPRASFSRESSIAYSTLRTRAIVYLAPSRLAVRQQTMLTSSILVAAISTSAASTPDSLRAEMDAPLPLTHMTSRASEAWRRAASLVSITVISCSS